MTLPEKPITNGQRIRMAYEAGRICRVVTSLRASQLYSEQEIAGLIGEIYEVDGLELIKQSEAMRYV